MMEVTAATPRADGRADGYVGRYNADGLRWCSGGCGYVEVALFQRRSASPDGYAEYCRVCRRERRRRYYARNREREIAAARAWQAAHPEQTQRANQRARRVHALLYRGHQRPAPHLPSERERRYRARRAAQRAADVAAARVVLASEPRITAAALAQRMGWSEGKAWEVRHLARGETLRRHGRVRREEQAS